MHVDADLCGGSILIVEASHPTQALLELRADDPSNIRQWFHFRTRSPHGEPVELRIVNAGDATYRGSWDGYDAFASYDLERWFRVHTTFDGQTLVLRHQPERQPVHWAYFAAFPLERHAALIAKASSSPRVEVTPVGPSLDGRPIEWIRVGSQDPDRHRIWIIARQHPGETMSEWFMEGLVDRLIDERNPLVRRLLESAVFYLVPNMNPDGSARGNFRTNAAGHDLNRQWVDPSMSESPEIVCVRDAMQDIGADMFLDIHGDEHASCAFAVGCEGNPGFSARQRDLERRFAEDLTLRNEHFSADWGYGFNDPGKGDLRIANNWVGEHFDCLSLTIEMPFKGRDPEDPLHSFSPSRARRLGSSTLESIFACLGSLR